MVKVFKKPKQIKSYHIDLVPDYRMDFRGKVYLGSKKSKKLGVTANDSQYKFVDKPGNLKWTWPVLKILRHGDD
tara:strand:- start:75 stop:296 length:222 start_codon:yes stop_codon:yes gene_type:complete